MLNMEVVDEYNNVHYAKKLLATLDYGAVYLTEKTGIVLYIANTNTLDGFNHFEIKQEKICNYLDSFSDNNIPKCITSSLVCARLIEPQGYIFKIKDDFTPLINIVNRNELFKSLKDGEILPFNQKRTFSLKQRILLAISLVKSLSQLHCINLYPKELTLTNVFYDKNNHLSVQFIDLLNFEISSNSDKSQTNHEYSCLIDPAFISFSQNQISSNLRATNIFELVMMLLFILSNSEELEVLSVFKNEIFTPESNFYKKVVELLSSTAPSVHQNISNSLLLNPKINQLFNHTLINGNSLVDQRPLIIHWMKPLVELLDTVSTCPDCGNESLIVNDGQQLQLDCCDNVRNYATITVTSYEWDNKNYKFWYFTDCITADNCIELPERLFRTFTLDNYDTNLVRLEVERDNLYLEVLQGQYTQYSFAINSDFSKFVSFKSKKMNFSLSSSKHHNVFLHIADVIPKLVKIEIQWR